ncbi:MAG: hypothetical protein ACOY7T_15505 [Pseudomonadota bacterium]
MKFHRKSSLLACASMILLPSAAFADEGTTDEEPGVWRLGAGVNYSEGDYGDPQKTTVVSAPVSLRYRKGGFNFRVSVPFVSIDGPGSLLDTPQGRDAGFGDSGGDSGGDDNGGDSSGSNSGSGSSGSNSGSGSSGSNSGSGSSGSGSSGSGGGSDDGGSTSTGGDVVPVAGAAPSRRSGIGDVSISLGYSVPLGSATWFDVTGRVKLPTASTAKRLGTGKVDFTVGGDLVQDIGDLSLYAGGRYRFLGKPAGSTLRNTWGAGAGASYRLPGGTYVGADYGWQESATPGRGPSSEVTGWINFGVSKRLRMQVFASTGFNANSADFAGGLSLSYRLN